MIIPALVFSLIILFFHSTTWDGHIFEKVKKIIKPEWKISNPIYGCPICMSPWYGSIFYLFVDSNHTVIEWLLLIFTIGGFSVIWATLITIRTYLKPNEADK